MAAYRVEGLRSLLRVTDQMGKEVKKGVRDELRAVAEPARSEAQHLFLSDVNPDERYSRYGISVRATGMVSIEQRRKSRSRLPQQRRPNFTALQWEKVLDPVAEDTAPMLEEAMMGVLDRLERKWLVGV